jgi:hypothetical protein
LSKRRAAKGRQMEEGRLVPEGGLSEQAFESSKVFAASSHRGKTLFCPVTRCQCADLPPALEDGVDSPRSQGCSESQMQCCVTCPGSCRARPMHGLGPAGTLTPLPISSVALASFCRVLSQQNGDNDSQFGLTAISD